MARENREWHPEFLKYMDFIATHENYRGLPIERNRDGSYKWIVTAQTETGAKRIEWCLNKAKELGFPIQAGVYADVMLAIHPTKEKVSSNDIFSQFCGYTPGSYVFSIFSLSFFYIQFCGTIQPAPRILKCVCNRLFLSTRKQRPRDRHHRRRSFSSPRGEALRDRPD